jgi:ZIP family zinc transporter
MVELGALAFVFVAGLITALATGLGALPFFFVAEIPDRWTVLLWGFSSGIMVAASLFGLVTEGLQAGTDAVAGVPAEATLAVGVLAGAVTVLVTHDLLEAVDVDPKQYEAADYRSLVLILGVLTVHSFPEGVAVGVSFADLGLVGGLQLLGLSVPLLAVFMTVAISIHNVPEGTAISIPLREMGVGEGRMVWWAVFSSLPQPVGAVLAFYFVRIARDLLPFGFGFAAGAMVYLVATEFLPEGLAAGADLPGGGRRELIGGVAAGAAVMLPLAFVQV